ncbi:MAG: hypothetical protein OXK76_07625 [Gammaproteobacteria bacterium]|nr:hypothetical protein [Gammaproteobacteria bacterium]
MGRADRKRSGPDVAAQTSASWAGHDATIRGEALAGALQNQDRALGEAMVEMQRVRDFIGSPQHILGNANTKHGEIAEQVHVGVRRATDALNQRPPSAAIDEVPRTGPVDYVDGGLDIQSKYYNGLRNTLEGVASHAEEYETFAAGEGRYHIPRDQFEQLRELGETGTVEGQSQGRIEQLKAQIESLERTTGRPIEDLVEPGEGSYDEVQQGAVHKTVDAEERQLKREDEQLRDQARQEHGPSLAGSLEAAAVGAAVGAGVTLAGALWAKHREGKSPFREDGFSTEDWKDIGLNVATAAGTGAVAGFSVYWLTNSTDLAAPFAGSLVSGLMGIGALLKEHQQGDISDEEFADLSVIVAAEAAVVGIAAVAGQTLIPVPLLGALIGSVAGKLVASAVKDGLGEAEEDLIGRLRKFETAAIQRLDEALEGMLVELDALFGRLEDLARLAFDEGINAELRLAASVRFAEALDVRRDRIIRSRDDLDVFMQE